MLLRQILLPAALLPAACAAGVWLLAAVLTRRGLARGGLAIAAAFASSVVASTGWPRWVPVEATERLFFLVLLAAVLALALDFIPGRWRGAAVAVARPLFGLALLALVLESVLRHRWSGGQAIAWFAGLLLIFLALGWAIERGLAAAGDRGEDPRGGRSRWLAPLARLALLGGTAAVLGLSGSARLAFLAGALTSGVFAVEALALALGRPAWVRGDGWALTAAVSGLLLIGHFYSALPATNAILLLASYLLVALPGRAWWGRLAPLVPLAAALALTLSAYLAREDDLYDYYSALPTTAAPVAAPAAAGGGALSASSSPPKRVSSPTATMTAG